MKYIFLSFSLLFFLIIVSAQPLLQNQVTAPPVGNTYAIVIGISAYQDPDIPKLSFPGRDATIFSDFLMSASGGNVPKQNIKLLTDSMATIGEVDKAIRWVMNNCRENDKVFFYFSGHGEMENVTISKNGYLICYNTPSVAFVNMGLSIDYLNDIVNTISVQTKAKVIVITDACHSGTMAGNKFKGNFFVGEQLMLKKENEIRMASSKPDQLSNEKEDWGGGRGVFSYYLVNGLQGGLADADHDGVVSVGELKNYLENKMANDPVLKTDGDVQTPVISGSSDFRLATVVESEAKKIKAQVNHDSAANMMLVGAMPPMDEDDNAEPSDYFFTLLKKQQLEGLTDSLALNTLAPDEIAFALIGKLKRTAATETRKQKLAELETALKHDTEKLSRFNLDIASAFLDVGQVVITNYIRGDEAELERRRYYNSNNKGYDVYTRMFAVAQKLSGTDKYYGTKAEVFLHYFSGLALRLKIPLTEDPAALIEQALAEQKKALALEEYAAYIYNELGVLYQYKKMFPEAESYYTKASELSPGWAIPQANLSGIYLNKKLYSRALAYADKADSLQKDFQSVTIAHGLINEKQGNLLFAEEDYRHGIELNSRHYLPFERLGYVYLNTTNYALADSFFYEAELRKKGYHFRGNDWGLTPWAEPLAPTWFPNCKVDSSILEPTDIFAFFTWGVQEYQEKKYNNAVRILRKVVAVETGNPLVYHYLGKIYYDQQKWEEAELMFRLAAKYSKDLEEFKLYTDSVIRSKKYRYDHECFETFFKTRFYKQVEDYYFLGTLCENWSHFEEAEKYFRQIIHFDTIVHYYQGETEVRIKSPNAIDIAPSEKTTAYVKLWRLLEKQGRYIETEAAITAFASLYEQQSDEELNEFYRRMIGKYPDNGEWPYRLGNLLYKYAPLAARLQYVDSIVRFPLLNKEMFIDSIVYPKLASGNDSLALYDRSETGSLSKVVLEINRLHLRRQNYEVPGTQESILSADAIYMPRMDGIAYLQRAAELLSEKETLADIHFKTGNIYLWAGSKKQAYPYFERSLTLVPGNANARLTLVDIYKGLYKNRAAFNQLNYLNDSNQINLSKRILFARFNICAGYFDKANESLNKAESYVTYKILEINGLHGLAGMLADKPKEAIGFYQKSVSEDAGNLFNYYSLARLYARTGDNNKALQFLETAIGRGFNYAFVLQKDPYMDKLRKTEKWNTLLAGMKKKEYKAVVKL